MAVTGSTCGVSSTVQYGTSLCLRESILSAAEIRCVGGLAFSVGLSVRSSGPHIEVIL